MERGQRVGRVYISVSVAYEPLKRGSQKAGSENLNVGHESCRTG